MTTQDQAGSASPDRSVLIAFLFFVLVVVGASVALAFLLIAWGLVATPASRFQTLMATVPLLTVFLSALQGIESISLRGVLGSLLVVGGIAITVGGTNSVLARQEVSRHVPSVHVGESQPVLLRIKA
jgi:drug/metabolite transporter (DMT)-like permease